MNIDLLTKLVKLANHNPNDNEANLAARKVCSIIEEAKFKFVEDKINYSSPMDGSNWDKSTVVYNDLMNIMRNIYYNPKSAYEPPSNSYRSEPYTWNWNEVKKEDKPKIKVTCKECKLEIERPYNDKLDKENYICSICAWQAYMREKVNK